MTPADAALVAAACASAARAAVRAAHEEVAAVHVSVVPRGGLDERSARIAAARRAGVEGAVRRAALAFDEVAAVTHLTAHLRAAAPAPAGAGGAPAAAAWDGCPGADAAAADAAWNMHVDIALAEHARIDAAPALAAELRATLKALPGVADADIHLELTEVESEQRAEAARYRAARDAASADEGTRARTGTIYRAGRRRG